VSPIELRIGTPEQMRELGAALGRVAEPGDRFLLEGSFGAGKTTFVQGLARGLQVAAPVSSPSFVIETQHRGRLVLYHVDLYRLDRIEPELLQSLEEHLYGDGVTAVEWAERLPASVSEGATRVHFAVRGDDLRVLTIEPASARVRAALQTAA
jgi:tRNA threonylcarbamoyladenosine biosynthesis protein TsaE